MSYSCFPPSSAPKKERSRRLRHAVLAGVVMAGLTGAPCDMLAAELPKAELPKIASINLCTDQLLMQLADSSQILGLSPFSRDIADSWDFAKAAQFTRLSGLAEDVLMLHPDLVVAGSFTKLATRTLLKEKGVRVAEFDVAQSLDDVKKQIRRMGDLTGHPDRAADEIERLDSAVARLRQVSSQKPFRVLPVSRRGWISGTNSLTSSLLANAGLSNAAGDLGLTFGGFASLEAIISARPDLILVTQDDGIAEDEGSAFLLHPALEKFYPSSRRLVIPERLTVCGGSMLTEALDRLASELARVSH